MASVCAAEPEADGLERIVPARYTFNRTTITHPRETDEKPIYGDPRLRKLTDGERDAQAPRVVWRSKGWEGGRTLDIDVTFERPADLRRIAVHSLRRRGYAVTRIQVFGRGDDGEAVVGDATLNQSWAYPPQPEMPPTRLMVLAVPCEPKVVSEARVRLHMVSYLGLAEIEFFGVPVATPVGPTTSTYTIPPAPDGETLRVLARDLNGDGRADFLMENAYAAYVVDPRFGGVVNVALNKRTGVDLVKPNAKGTWGGLFADRMYPTGRGDFFGQPYAGELVDDSADRVAVRVRGNGKSGQFAHITFEKTYSLQADSVALRADYRVLNGQDNVVAVDYGAWVLNGMGSTQEATRVFWADEAGARELKELGTQYVYEPRRGWLGMLTKSGSGIAMVSEYRRTASFLLWRSGDFATVEFKMGRYPIEAGGSIAMTAWAVPFDGIGTPHGVSPAMVGSMDVTPTVDTEPETLAFVLKPSRTGSFTIIVESRRLPDGEWGEQARNDAVLQHAPNPMTVALRGLGPGTHVLRVRAERSAQEVFTMERAVVVREASGPYAMAPECERHLPESAEDRKGRTDYHSLEYRTEHVPWAKRWAGGKPTVLFLPRKRAGIREAVEIAQRFEMECRTSYLPRSVEAGCLYDLADFAGRLNAPQLMKGLRKRLSEPDFDAIVIAGDLWKDLTPDMQASVLDRVKAGTGLVLLAPEHAPAELDGIAALAQPEEKVGRVLGAWKKTGDHFVTDGIPFDALPGTLALPYRMAAEPLATVGEHPLLALDNLGAGRVAVASWVVGGLRRDDYHQTYGGVGLLPNMLALGAEFSCDFHYWEYQMSLLTRVIYWAAGKETSVRGDVAISQMAADGTGRALVRLRDEAAGDTLTVLRWSLRDRFSREVDSGSVRDVALGTEETSIPITLRNAVLDGPVYLEARAVTEGGTSWWGIAAGRVRAPARIEHAALAKRVWRREEHLAGKARIVGALDAAQVIFEGVDSFGRVFARQRVSAQPDVTCELPLKDCLGLTGHLVARLDVDGKIVSEERRPFVVYRVPDATRMQVAFGWPSVSYEGQRRFLHRDYYRRLVHLGATSLRTQHVTPFEWFEARSLGLPTLKSRVVAGIGGKHPDTREAGKGKFGLVRKPCLSVPGFREDLVTDNARATAFEDAGVLYRGMGDEINSISNWDGCFSAHCQDQFRTWLKERYGDLAALNREWATSYTAWGEVVAMTGEEVAQDRSLAPWVDHRLFNNWNWTRAMASVREGSRRANPDIRLGFSGTQETKPWNAYDWWEICKSVSAVASYSGEQVAQRRSFSEDMYSMPWIGYTATFEQTQQTVLSGLFDGDRGFNVFSGRFMVNPDYTIPDKGAWLRRALAAVDGGRAEVIMASRYDAGPVAFHYSPASVCVDQALQLSALRVAEAAGARRLLLEQSADYDYIAYAQLAQGAVASRDGRGYRLLVLPASTAMADAECDTVRRWVEAGGILIGGFGTATYTEHGRRRDKGALDAVFGLNRARSRCRSGSARVRAVGSAHGIAFDGYDIPVENLETGLSAAGATIVGWADLEQEEHPAVLVNRHGDGVAVYLAADVLSTCGVWGATRRMASRMQAAQGMDRFITSVLRLARVEARPRPLTDAGERLACTRMIFRRNGLMRLVGVIRDWREARNLDPEPHPVSVQFGQTWHIYDLTARTYAGRSDVYRDTFGPGTHRALALLPYEVKGLALDVAGAPEAKRGEQIVLTARLLAQTERLAEHWVHVEVFGPDNELNPGYDDLLVLRDGSAPLRLPLALNAALGTWQVKATDAVSNCTARERFTVVE